MMQRLKSYRMMKEHQQDYELSSVLQNSMSMFGGSMMNAQSQGPPPLHHNASSKGGGGISQPSAHKLYNPHQPASSLYNRGFNCSGSGSGPTGGGGVFSPPPPNHGHNSPNSSMPAYLRNSMGSPNRQSAQFSQRSMTASNISRGDRLQNMPSMLRSILREQNIDYENDFYWLSKVSLLYCFHIFIPSNYVLICKCVFLSFNKRKRRILNYWNSPYFKVS